MEQRKNQRQDLSAVVAFSWKASDGSYRQGTGRVRDLSAGGMFVLTEAPPPVESVVNLKVEVEPSVEGSLVMIRAKARVCRVEMLDVHGAPGGFAASARSMRLQKASGLSRGSDGVRAF